MSPLTLLEPTLRPIARESIATGQLPKETPSKMWGGHGGGEFCALCDKPIAPDEVEIEFEGYIDGAERTFRLHAVYQSIWQLECARAAAIGKRPFGEGTQP